MFGYELPQQIVEHIKSHQRVELYSNGGKLSREPSPVRAVTVFVTSTPKVLSDDNRELMESNGVPLVQFDPEMAVCKEFMPSRYFENAPYEGRFFLHGLLDCYTLFRDWYSNELGIDIPWNIEKPFGWWMRSDSLYLKYMKEAGFSQQRGVMQRGDVLLFAIGAQVTNHAAVYLGGNEMLHHLNGRLSCVEEFTDRWKSHRTAICRHERMFV